MLNLMQYFKLVEKFTKDNSPLILTVIGVSGTVTTAVLASKATLKARDHYRWLEENDADALWDGDTPPSLFRKVKVTWKFYLPTVATLAVTGTCIIFANRIGTKRAAAMAAAYTIVERNFDEYKEKVTEKLGEKEERKVREELAQDRVLRNPPPQNSGILVAGKASVPFYDSFSGIWFESSMEDVKHAINKLNHKLNHHGYASLNDFYDCLGVSQTTMGNILGWDADELLDPYFTTTVTDDERPAFHMEYRKSPFDGYGRTH